MEEEEPASNAVVVPLKFPPPYILPAELNDSDEVELPPTPTLFVISPLVVCSVIDVAVTALLSSVIPLLLVRFNVPLTFALSADTDSVFVPDDVLFTYAFLPARVSVVAYVFTAVVLDADF